MAKSLSNASKMGEPKPDPVKVERIRKIAVSIAGNCRKHEQHGTGRVYRTDGKTRYCVCDQCGDKWKVVGPYADELKEFCEQLRKSLEKADRAKLGDDMVIIMDDEVATTISSRLKELIG